MDIVRVNTGFGSSGRDYGRKYSTLIVSEETSRMYTHARLINVN